MLVDVQVLGLTNADGKLVQNVETLRSTYARVRAEKRREAKRKQQNSLAPKR
jgi:hypothetical protein